MKSLVMVHEVPKNKFSQQSTKALSDLYSNQNKGGGGQTPSSFARQETSDTVLEILDLFPILYTCFSS